MLGAPDRVSDDRQPIGRLQDPAGLGVLQRSPIDLPRKRHGRDEYPRPLETSLRDVERGPSNGGQPLPRYKQFTVKKVELAELAPQPKNRQLTPRQLARQERD